MNTFGKILWSLLVAVIGLIPVWLYLIARMLLTPNGFWQELVLAGISLWVLGSIQVILFIGLLILLFAIWNES